MEDFTIVVNNKKRWIRLALLLESETKDQEAEKLELQKQNFFETRLQLKPTIYNTFYYDDTFINNDIDWYHDKRCYDISELENSLIWFKHQTKYMWKEFIDNI